VDGDEVTELLTQTAFLETSFSGILRLRWKLIRRGEFAWDKADGVWVIARVDVLPEKISRAGWRSGF